MAVRPQVCIIDGSSFLYRAYYGLKPLTAPSGEAVHAAYGFIRMIKKLLQKRECTYAWVVWDAPGKNIRHELFPEYKAQRQAAPSDLFSQKVIIKEFCDSIGLQQLEISGFEADDTMYSMAVESVNQGMDAFVVTVDKDMRQIVNGHITLYDPFREIVMDTVSIEERYGFPLSRLPLYFSLCGDASDGIPGVPGIGPKGATQIVQQCATLDEVYERVSDLPKRTQSALLANKELAYLSEKLIALHTVELPVRIVDGTCAAISWEKARPLYERYNFASLLKELPVNPLFDQRPKVQQPYPHERYSFVTISSLSQMHDLVKEAERVGICAMDTETDGVHPRCAHCVGISFSVVEGTAYYVPLAHVDNPSINWEEYKPLVQALCSNKEITKVFHNAVFDLHILRNLGITCEGVIEDTVIMAHLLGRYEKLRLKYLSEACLEQPMLSYEEVVKPYGTKYFGAVPVAHAIEYAAADAHQTLLLYYHLHELLKKDSALFSLYTECERPLIPIIQDMEYTGIALDIDYLVRCGAYLEEEMKAVKEQIAVLLPDGYQNINLQSSQQLSQLLFEELKLPPQKKTTKRTGYSTDQEVLEALASYHPIPALLVKYREMAKLQGTYVQGVLSEVAPCTGRIHTHYSQISVATGRLSSNDPNMQNIPQRALANGLAIRDAFVADPGCVLAAADYSQIELRVLAHLTNDPVLVKAFLAGDDIHRYTAAGLFNKAQAEITDEERNVAKRINFSILYGLTAYGLSQDLDIPRAQAQAYIDAYKAHYPTVFSWMDTVVEEAKEAGYVQTEYGRKRPVLGLREKNKTLYDAARRVAVNTVVQGTAAELMKKGMIAVYELFAQKYPSASLLLQIHDEIVWQMPQEIETDCTAAVVERLQSLVSWNIPLVVHVGSASRWGAIKK